jgi:hypothetical protein
MTPRYDCSVKSSCFGGWGDYGGVDLGDAEVEAGVAGLALPGGVGTRGWVGVGHGRCCKVVVGGGGMCARQLSGCRLVVPWTSCPWWPSFQDNLLWGAHSPRHGIGSRICMAAASVPGLFLWCHCRGLRGGILGGGRFLRLGADWLCCAPVVGFGCPDRSLAAKAWSKFCWTTEGPLASSKI